MLGSRLGPFRILAELGSVPEALLREIAVQIAAGLESIHGNGIVHRDLKPENVPLYRDITLASQKLA